ncbi:MAG: membrane protein [Saprospiraceae bacterium]|nr:MAG: membrane protein [Saprospiraceae bacterium]
MKNYKIFRLLFLMLILSISACDKKLDISPRQSIETDNVFTSASNLEAALLGAYSEIKGTFGVSFSGELYGGDFNVFSEMLAANGNVAWGGSFIEYREIFNKAISTTNPEIRNNWIRAYNAINNVNSVLDNLDVVTDPDQRDQIEGEALAIRGMLYFEMVRLWSRPWGTGTESTDPGIPLVLKSINSVADAEATANLGRFTVAQVYTQVIDDLMRAETLLAPFGSNGTRISTYTASAILSRVYLQQSEFGLAAQAADRVISSDLYSLVPSPLSAFNNSANSTEDIFAIQQTALSNAGTNNAGLATFYARLNGSGRGDIQIQESQLALFEAGDLRGGLQEDLPGTATIVNVNQFYYIGVGGQNSGFIQTAKYGDGNLNIPLVRLSEMYLTRAEGNFEAGTNIGSTPLEDINIIRKRAGLDNLTDLSQGDIRLERQKELAFEGFALHDKKRWKMDIADLAFDAPELVLPIPERELEVYDIAQNAGY